MSLFYISKNYSVLVAVPTHLLERRECFPELVLLDGVVVTFVAVHLCPVLVQTVLSLLLRSQLLLLSP